MDFEKLTFGSDDSIAIFAPHPDDECLCAAAALIMAPEITDVCVISDESRGNVKRNPEKEAIAIALNRYRGTQASCPSVKYAECYLELDPYSVFSKA